MNNSGNLKSINHAIMIYYWPFQISQRQGNLIAKNIWCTLLHIMYLSRIWITANAIYNKRHMILPYESLSVKYEFDDLMSLPLSTKSQYSISENSVFRLFVICIWLILKYDSFQSYLPLKLFLLLRKSF